MLIRNPHIVAEAQQIQDSCESKIEHWGTLPIISDASME